MGRAGTREGGRRLVAEELGGVAVLVVDDEPVVRAYVARALGAAGMDVATAADGREAFRLVAEDRVRPDLIVTDIEMPGMSGVELAARLLAIRPSVRIVMMTGDAARADAARRHPAIVDDVLLKPMRLEDLLETVRAVAARDQPGAGRRSRTKATRSEAQASATTEPADAAKGEPDPTRP